MNRGEVRRTVVDVCRELSHRGHLAGTGGNVALRIDAAHFAVTPSATDYLTMDPADVCVLRLADLVQVDGERKPSVESGLHARLLRARPAVTASIHTHQPVASACALLGRALDVPAGPLRHTLGPRVPVVGYAPSGTRWLSARLGRVMQVHADSAACLLFNHGVLCCGATVPAALQAVEDLEALARQHLGDRMAAEAQRHPERRAAVLQLVALLAGPVRSHPSSPP